MWIWVWRCESWTSHIKKAHHQKIDTSELWCWRSLLRVPWAARRSNQSIIKEFSPEYSLEGLMMKLKLQYFGHLMQRSGSLEKTLMLGKIEGRKRRGLQRMRCLVDITDSMVMCLSKLWELVMDREATVLHSMGSQSWTRLSYWSELIRYPVGSYLTRYWMTFKAEYIEIGNNGPGVTVILKILFYNLKLNFALHKTFIGLSI